MNDALVTSYYASNGAQSSFLHPTLKATALTKKIDEKYRLYSLAVQNPEAEIEIIEETYSRINRRLPNIMREDFCGAFLNSVRWVKSGPKRQAIGLDLDAEPLGYGIRTYLPELTAAEQKRLFIKSGDVLTTKTAKADVICALNFSYCCFHDRATLRKYFQQCRKSLASNGILMMDCFGGPANVQPHKDIVKFPKRGFTYFWQLKSYDYVNCRAHYAIHFQPKGRPLMRNAFEYDWRIWTIPELRELMAEAGFSRSQVLLEGTTRRGEGDGEYKPALSSTESCETWLAYVVGIA